jgi:hypothetical protein
MNAELDKKLCQRGQDGGRNNMKKALKLHFEGLSEDGEAIPKPRGVNSYRRVMKDLDVNEYFLAHVQVDTNRFAAAVGHD